VAQKNSIFFDFQLFISKNVAKRWRIREVRKDTIIFLYCNQYALDAGAVQIVAYGHSKISPSLRGTKQSGSAEYIGLILDCFASYQWRLYV